MELNKIIHGDVLKVLKEFPDNSVDCIITSPPYYSLRKYPEEANVEWSDGIKCQLGLEPTPEMYIEHLGLILKEIYRVLKPTGTFWLNIGDTYLKKQMLCIPERVLFKALEIGFILRNKIVWMKPNCLPSSVKDRLTNTYEFVYLLTKKPKYYFNLDAIRVPLSEKTIERVKRFIKRGEHFDPTRHKSGNVGGQNPMEIMENVVKSIVSFNYRVREAKKGHFGIVGVRASKEEMEKYDEKGVKIIVKERSKKYKEVDVNSPGGREWYITWKRNLPSKEEIYQYLKYWKEKRGLTLEEIKKAFGDEGDKVSHWFTHPDSTHGFAYPSPEDWKKLKEILKFDDRYDEVMFKQFPVLVTDKGSIPVKHDVAVGRVGNFSYSDPLHTKPIHYLGKNPGDMWELTTEPFPEAHFAVFPVKLVVRCIVAGCPPNGIVLDPFMGSGTVALACELLNHKMWDKIPKFEEIVNPEVVKSIDWNLKWIGIEIVKDYIDMTYRRLNKEIYNNSKPLTEWLK